VIIKTREGPYREFSLFGARFRVLLPREKSESTEIIEESWPPGSEAPLNVHAEMEQLYFVLSGHAHVIIDNENGELEAGDIALIPRGAHHMVKNVGEEDLRYLCFDIFPSGCPNGEETWEAHERVIFERFASG